MSDFVEATKRSIIGELFVRSADENYITARWAAMQHLHTDFAWLAVHALEKYLKAILLINGRSAIAGSSEKPFGHNIVKLASEVKNLAGKLIPDELNKPDNQKIPLYRKQSTSSFIESLYKIGEPDNRYKIFGTNSYLDYTTKLDQMVFIYRRLILPLDSHIEFQQNLEENTYRNFLQNDNKYLGWEKMPLILAVRGPDTPLKNAILNCNFPFAPQDYPHDFGFVNSSWRESPIERHIYGPLNSGTDKNSVKDAIELGQWLCDNIKLPKNLKDDIAAATNQARKRLTN